MDAVTETKPGNWIAALRGFAGTQQAVVERCELCNAEIVSKHAHLIEPESRRILCACTPCALLFSNNEAKHYRRVPGNAQQLREFKLSDAQWDAFQIPINMAFFFRSSTENRVLAMYPGPAGATESKLDLEAWDDLAAANPVLRELQDDVEALLVNRVQGAHEYFRMPIDRCYELVGHIRRHWHGLSGGDGVREAIQTFFASVREDTTGNEVSAHA
ncbi:MAG: DUF5947 family protein [Gammaproteobacteria bacterium]